MIIGTARMEKGEKMIIKICILIMLVCTIAISISDIWTFRKMKKAWKEYEEWKDKLDGKGREE